MISQQKPKNYYFFHHPDCSENNCTNICPVSIYKKTGIWIKPVIVKEWVVTYKKHKSSSFYLLKIYRARIVNNKIRYEFKFKVQNSYLTFARELDNSLSGMLYRPDGKSEKKIDELVKKYMEGVTC